MRATRAATFSLCIFGSLFTLGIMVYAGRGWRQSADWWLGFIAFGLWNLTPYVGLTACGLLAKRTKGQARTAFVGSLLVFFFGVLLLVDGFVLHADAQTALAFIVLPLYQLIGVAVLIMLLWRLGRRRSETVSSQSFSGERIQCRSGSMQTHARR